MGIMIDRMEKKYGIVIRDDSFWSPLKRKYIKCYRIYTADGCPWENGLTYRGFQMECKKYGDTFKEIKRKVEGK